jgi:hypothetical protein
MLADFDGMWCCSMQINQCKCVFSTSMQVEHLPFHHFETQFQFSVLVLLLKTGINVSLTATTSVAIAHGQLLLQGTGFYFTVLFMGFLPQIVLACTIVYLLVVKCNVLTFTALLNSFSFQYLLSYT